jgi:pullulanase
MNFIRSELTKLRPGILLYGEGWTADKSPMPENLRAVKANLHELRGIAAFNDNFRDALKGNHGSKKSIGFVSGLGLNEESVKLGIVGGINHHQINFEYIQELGQASFSEPSQCVNYISCHDNYTLWDKLKMSLPKEKKHELVRRVKLAGAIVLTSQGIPFLHAGVEFCRTKSGNGNSYKSPDSVNQLDWNRKKEYYDVFEYYRKIIQLRKKHPAFRIPTTLEINKNLNFCTQYKIGVVSYCIDGAASGDLWQKVTVIFNGNNKNVTIPLPEGEYQVIANAENIDEKGLGVTVSNEVIVEPLSMLLLVSEN